MASTRKQRLDRYHARRAAYRTAAQRRQRRDDLLTAALFTFFGLAVAGLYIAAAAASQLSAWGL